MQILSNLEEYRTSTLDNINKLSRKFGAQLSRLPISSNCSTDTKTLQELDIQLLDIQTSIFFSPEQTRSRSSPVPVPDTADIGSGENLIDQSKSEVNFLISEPHK